MTTFLDDRVAVEAELEPPPRFHAHRRLVPDLGYPVELFAITNASLRATRRDDSFHAWPRVTHLKPGEMLLWGIVGDYAFDDGAAQLTGPNRSLPEEAIRGRNADEVSFVPPLSERDQGGRGDLNWPNVYMWWRQVVVSSRHYLDVYAFANGPDDYQGSNRPPEELSRLVGSMKVRDYS